MRIRNLKPEFWNSEDIAGLSWSSRLIFIGMLSYVDDNGVGRDIEKIITSSLFPLEDDVHATRMQITCSLNELHAAGLINRYTVEEKAYLEIAGWTKHQYVPRPNKPRYPSVTCENAVIRRPNMQPATNDMQPAADSLRVSEGQGVRGSGGQVLPLRNYVPQELANLSQRDRINFGAKLVNEFLSTLPNVTFPTKTRQELTAHTTACLQDGVQPIHIARGLTLWNEAGYPASTLPTSILQAQREALGAPPPGTPRPRRATGTERAKATLEIAAQMQQEEEDDVAF